MDKIKIPLSFLLFLTGLTKHVYPNVQDFNSQVSSVQTEGGVHAIGCSAGRGCNCREGKKRAQRRIFKILLGLNSASLYRYVDG